MMKRLFSHLSRLTTPWLSFVVLAYFSIYASGALTPAAQELVGSSEDVLRTLSRPVPRNFRELRTEDGLPMMGIPTRDLLNEHQNNWKTAVTHLLGTLLFRNAVYVETALRNSGSSEPVDLAVAHHFENQQRNFYHLGGDIYLTKAGPEAQQAYKFFSHAAAYSASDANSAILVWRKDRELGTDPQLIIAAAFHSPDPQGHNPDPMLQVRELVPYRLQLGPRSERLYRFDETERHRVFVPQEVHVPYIP